MDGGEDLSLRSHIRSTSRIQDTELCQRQSCQTQGAGSRGQPGRRDVRDETPWSNSVEGIWEGGRTRASRLKSPDDASHTHIRVNSTSPGTVRTYERTKPWKYGVQDQERSSARVGLLAGRGRLQTAECRQSGQSDNQKSKGTYCPLFWDWGPGWAPPMPAQHHCCPGR